MVETIIVAWHSSKHQLRPVAVKIPNNNATKYSYNYLSSILNFVVTEKIHLFKICKVHIILYKL